MIASSQMRNLVIKRCVIGSIFLICLSVSAQFNAGRLVTEKFYTEIPFEYVHNKIVIEATMNGVKGRYLFDTGAMCILFKDSAAHQFAKSSDMRIGDATGKKRWAQVVQVPLIEVGGLAYENLPALYVETFEGPFRCLGYKGIIGSNLLRFGAFKVDWQKRRLIIADSYQTLGAGSMLSAKLYADKKQSSPFVKVKVNDKNIKWVLVDTGSDDSFSLYAPTASWLIKKGVLGQADYSSTGSNSHGAWGAGQHARSFFKALDLEIGNTWLTKVSVETSSGKSKIGMKLLEKGNFILDYPQKRIFFEEHSDDSPITIEGFGIDLIMLNEQFLVNGVWIGTAAEAGGVEKGDVVENIEGMNFSDKTICEAFLTLKELTRNRQELTFFLRKSDAQETYKITLKRIKI
ncbi:aspartyl protease family protein [Carboxylicivirga taeanensis]|uniref:retropepsin-like aspartic protease n=1 Tax=Carboxylicivirga taeanensis TaxID=1416875 RepID=UPI003F6DDEB0